ncbi:MAG: D-glycero-beta-D-manno-heptose 1-phosphate adenylyltransferase [Pseudomonadota bacterium]
MTGQALKSLILSARNQCVLCLGDAMLDTFIYGDVERVSPEAPVPVLRETHRIEMPGGAANTARNLAALGARARLVAAVGADGPGDALRTLLGRADEIASFLVQSSTLATIQKKRFVSSGQQLLRVDKEPVTDLDWETERSLVSEISRAASGATAILISDYAKGSVTEKTIATALKAGKDDRVPLVVDPKGHDLARYGPVALIKPNAGELAAVTNLPTGTDAEIEAALEKALGLCAADAIMVTRAAKGLSFIERTEPTVRHMRGEARDVYDVSGAGDTSLAALGIAIASGVPLSLAAEYSLLASGIAVTKAGTATVTAAELLDNDNGDVMPMDTALDLVERWRGAREIIGFTNGCFDILHPGHLKVLEEAKSRCDRLIVGLNSDASVRRLKGEARPVNDEASRARLLSALSSVDGVVLFEEDTPIDLIERLQPDLLVKGGDYALQDIVGADTVTARGGTVHIVPLLQGHSTTAIISRSKDPAE